MAEMRQCRGRSSACCQLAFSPLTSRGPGRTRRSARLPELAEVFGKLLAGCSPVVLDAVAQFDHVALEFKFVLLQPRDIELFTRSATFELAVNVLVVVANNPMRRLARLSIGNCEWNYFVMMPVVLRPSVRWVTRNIPFSLIGL